jgi:hypothetical protein
MTLDTQFSLIFVDRLLYIIRDQVRLVKTCLLPAYCYIRGPPQSRYANTAIQCWFSNDNVLSS